MTPLPTPAPRPSTEVLEKARRRTYTAEYKRQILGEAEGCTRPGEVSALLRREGLYSSHLSEWRRARERGEIAGATKSRGPAPKAPPDDRDRRIAELERENARLGLRARRAEAMVELQKKVAMFLETLGSDETGEKA